MNIIIETTGFNIGGMEVFFAGHVNYLLSHGHNVYFITKNISNDIYHTLIDFNDSNFHLIYRCSKELIWMDEKEAKRERDRVFSQLKEVDLKDTVAMVGYYIDFEYVLNLFRDNPVRMLMIWPHPLEWSNRLHLFFNRYHRIPKRLGAQFEVQKSLLKEMDDADASYYTSYAIKDYNQWYYGLKFKDRSIEGLPIQVDCGEPFKYQDRLSQKEFRVLWVGRFDFFKNDAIYYIYNCLKELSDSNPGIHFYFNIVGKGTEKYEKDIRGRLKDKNTDRLSVQFLGIVQPNQLTSVFSQNDIGIAMGVTVKQMGYTGLPAILIDSMSKNYNGGKCCNWVFDIATGDDGDGMYYQMANSPLEYRKELKELLSEVIKNPALLKEYSDKSVKYVTNHYMYERQNRVILERACASKFTGTNTPRFKHNYVMRQMWKIRGFIKRGNL